MQAIQLVVKGANGLFLKSSVFRWEQISWNPVIFVFSSGVPVVWTINQTNPNPNLQL